MKTALVAQRRINLGKPIKHIVGKLHGRQTAKQMIGRPAIYVFRDNSRLLIYGRGTSRTTEVE